MEVSGVRDQIRTSLRACSGRTGILLAVVLTGALTASSSFAQSFNVLAEFGSPEGMQPFGALVQGSDGAYYGMTAVGGSGNGTIFKIDAVGNMTTLAVFNKTNGARPESALIQAWDGNFYGTTRQGGTYGKGTVFRFTPSTRAITVLRSFNFTDGSDPNGLVQGNDGALYGT